MPKAAQSSRRITTETEGSDVSFSTRGKHGPEHGGGEIEPATACSLKFCLKEQRNGGMWG